MDLAIKIVVIAVLSLVIITSFTIFLIILKKIFLERIIKSSKEKKDIINKRAQIQLNTMTRFENMRKNENRFLECYKQLADCYQIINFKMIKIKSKYEELTTVSKIFLSLKFIKIHKEFKYMYIQIINKFDEFDFISGKLSKEWILFDNVWALLLEAIFTLNNYIEENKKILKNVIPVIEKKINHFSLELTKINNNKKDMSFTDTTNNLNLLQDKIKDFTYFIDASVNLEWALYNNLEKIIKKSFNPKYLKIWNKLQELRKNLITTKFEVIEKQTINFYKLIREEVISEIYSTKIVYFIEKNMPILENNQHWIETYFEKNKEHFIKSGNITNDYKKIGKIYFDLKKSISKVSNDIFEKFANYTFMCNQFYRNSEQFIIENNNADYFFKNFINNYNKTKNIYFEIITNEMLPNDQNVFDLQNKLNLEYKQYTNIINKVQKNNSYLPVDKMNYIINDWNKDLSLLIQKISENIAYKQMFEFLVEKIVNIKHKKNSENYRQMEKQLLFECKLEIDNNNYKNAYLMIKNYTKNRGKNVQQNFS